VTDASLSDTVKSTASDAADAVKDAASDAADKAAATADKAVEKGADGVAKAADKVSAGASEVSAKAGKAADAAAAKASGAVAAGADGSTTPPPPRTADEIEADLEATRARLAGRLDELQEYVAPKNVVNRQVAKVKSVFVDEYGGVKPDRVLIAAGVVAVVVGLRILRRRRRA
jgi:hypothetical protein